MRRYASFLFAALLILPLPPRVAHAEIGFQALSVTQTSQTFLLPKASANVLICNLGTNEVYYRLFDQNDIPAAATTSNAMLVAGTATAPVCISFDKGPTVNAYYSAISIICAGGETATAHVEYQ